MNKEWGLLRLLVVAGLASACAQAPTKAAKTPTQIPDFSPSTPLQDQTITSNPVALIPEDLVCATIKNPTIPNAYRAALAARGGPVGLDEPATLTLNDGQKIKAKLKDLNPVWNGNQVCVSRKLSK